MLYNIPFCHFANIKGNVTFECSLNIPKQVVGFKNITQMSKTFKNKKGYVKQCVNQFFQNITKDQVTLYEHSISITGKTLFITLREFSLLYSDISST